MAIWYEVTRYISDITPVEVLRFTDKTVTTPFGRRTRRGVGGIGNSSFFPTWREAYDWLLADRRKALRLAEAGVDHARRTLAEVEGLVEPTEELKS